MPRRLDDIVGELGEFAEVTVEGGLAILCAVGDNLRSDPRIAARVIGALEGFPVRMVSQAASRRNVTIVVRDEDLARGMAQLHGEFFQGATNTESAKGATSATGAKGA